METHGDQGRWSGDIGELFSNFTREQLEEMATEDNFQAEDGVWVVKGDARVSVGGNAKVVAFGFVEVEASGEAEVWAFNTVQVLARENSKVAAYENAVVVGVDTAQIWAENTVGFDVNQPEGPAMPAPSVIQRAKLPFATFEDLKKL
ncbi:MAG: hypothetical protein H0T78_12415 [Longispora sp.]|nr:hypothetical protein [Longispora sp. (in: high G+C Gram-positive bacteria)]